MQTTLDFSAARAKGHAAGDACARKAGSEWVEKMLHAVLWYARVYGSAPFTMEELRTHYNELPKPPDARAWGVVTRQAVARGIIVRTGGYRPAVSSNGSPKPLYRKA